MLTQHGRRKVNSMQTTGQSRAWRVRKGYRSSTVKSVAFASKNKAAYPLSSCTSAYHKLDTATDHRPLLACWSLQKSEGWFSRVLVLSIANIAFPISCSPG